MTGPPEVARKPGLLVLASTYPRWRGDHEPGFVHELCKRLAPSFAVTVLTPDAVGADASGSLDGVEVIRFRYAPRRFQTLVHGGGMLSNLRGASWKWLLVPTFVGGMLLAAWKQMRRTDIGVVHAHWLVPQGVVAVVARRAGAPGKPLLITSHGADLFALRSGPFRLLKRWVSRRASAVTVVSEAMRATASSIGIDDARLYVRPMGVDLDRFSPDPRVVRSRDRLLFVGRLVEKKGLRFLLDAMPLVIAEVPSATLSIVGFGPEDEVLRAQARRLGLDGQVEFVGGVAQAELPDLYRQAAALVVPFVEAGSGDQEGLGLVMVEALGCGCPVVTTSIPAVKDVFGGKWPDFCAQPGSAAALASEVIRFLRTQEQACAGVLALLPGLRARFDWDSVARGYALLLLGLRRS